MVLLRERTPLILVLKQLLRTHPKGQSCLIFITNLIKSEIPLVLSIFHESTPKYPEPLLVADLLGLRGLDDLHLLLLHLIAKRPEV